MSKAKQVLFIQGAGNEGHKLDAKLAASLQKGLGNGYDVNFPHLRTDETVSDFGWPEQIGKYISELNDDAFLVGHSLGASLLLKFLSERKVDKKFPGIFLISTPFWSGDEDWKKGLVLRKDFADKLPADVPLFLYHCHDDDEVPFSHVDLYKQSLTHATFREIPSGGHQLNNDLSLVAKDIKSLATQPT